MRTISKLAVAISLAACSAGLAAKSTNYQQWIEQMKEAPRGPFTKVQWFCKDGSVHPQKPTPAPSVEVAYNMAC